MAARAIETEYKGYLFRSRLEARWAVFFDALGIPYLYEPGGFDLSGTWYLPDFYLQRRLPVLGGEDREFYVKLAVEREARAVRALSN
jgi:hypothetical protein